MIVELKHVPLLLTAFEPTKVAELETLYWFLNDQGVADATIEPTESPDFIVRLGDKQIGVELTKAVRASSSTKFPVGGIESAVQRFGDDLLGRLTDIQAINIDLAINPDVPIDKGSRQEQLAQVEAKVRELAANAMVGVRTIIRKGAPGIRSKSASNKYVDLPSFINAISVINNTTGETQLLASIGLQISSFQPADLQTILDKKHRALKCYRICDEHWLVIAAGSTRPLVLPRPASQLPSTLCAFDGVEIQTPIESDFDSVYFYDAPFEVIQLK